MSPWLVNTHRFVREIRAVMRYLKSPELIDPPELGDLALLGRGGMDGAPKTRVLATVDDLLAALHAQDKVLYHAAMDWVAGATGIDAGLSMGLVMTGVPAARERVLEGWPAYARRTRYGILYALRSQTLSPPEAERWLSVVGPNKPDHMLDRILLLCVPGMERTSPSALVDTLRGQLDLEGPLHWPVQLLNLHGTRTEPDIRALFFCLAQRLPPEMQQTDEYRFVLSPAEQTVVQLWRALGGQPDAQGHVLLSAMLSAPAPEVVAAGCVTPGK